MRALTASVLVCLCALSFLRAPAAHTHDLVGDDDHHGFEFAHLHALAEASTPLNAPALHAPDPASDVRSSDWFVSSNLSAADQDLPRLEFCLADPLETSELLRAAPRQQSHDPPQLLTLPARAPPFIPA